MPRLRGLSFMSQWGARPSTPEDEHSEKATPSPSRGQLRKAPPSDLDAGARSSANSQTPDASAPHSPSSPSFFSRARGDSKAKRSSMVQGYNPPQIEVANETPPELQPIFTYLNSHSNKLYQEGYFLKLHDLDTRGRPSQDRAWTECFAQLIGTVLSLWDAAALDVAGKDGEVVPTFINLSDASIKMIESLSMNGVQGGKLQNVLSISTAANNRYLLHFNSYNSLTQWTAGIRLAMFEHTLLQEAYTGSLIAGKGRHVNDIKQIMFPIKYAYEDWARVRFGAGTPWQRCWCVISPPDEKEVDRAKKATKKASPYEKVRVPKGNIKFYDTRKVTKKTTPIATITHAFAVYAIYPQSRPLIEQSTLVKVEGLVTMNATQETSEGFVFVMPEVHQAVPGFEIMLRWLFPAFDTFGLYGRPAKLIADTLDQRGLMFAMPTSRRYGYLDTLDVSRLMHTKGSQEWTERQWRKELRKLTSERMMNANDDMSRQSSQQSRRRNTENTRPGVRFGSDQSARSTPGSRSTSPQQQPPSGSGNNLLYPTPSGSAPPEANSRWSPHRRATSEAQGYRQYTTQTPSRLSREASRPDSADGPPPASPPTYEDEFGPSSNGRTFDPNALERIQSGSQTPSPAYYNGSTRDLPPTSPHAIPPAPVGPPPAFTHQPNSRPVNQPYAPPELRRANSNVDLATLQEMRDATLPRQDPRGEETTWNGVVPQRQQYTVASQTYTDANRVMPADRSQGILDSFQYGHRLSTIPGSPFVGSDVESVKSSEHTFAPQLDGIADEPTPVEEYSQFGQPSDASSVAVPLQASYSIIRKPLPRIVSPVSPPKSPPKPDERPPALSRSLTDPTNSPLGENWEHVIINEVALDNHLPVLERASTQQTTTTQSSEPDYASSASVSTKAKQSIERPRAGKLKTVGNAEMPSMNEPTGDVDRGVHLGADSSSEIPGIDFGPTYDYTRMIGTHPGASPTPKPGDRGDRSRSRSRDRLLDISHSNPSELLNNSTSSSPNDSSKHRSYFDGTRTPGSGGRTPTGLGTRTPEPLENAPPVMWQPAASPVGPPQTQSPLTPEEWVQQRAIMAQQSQYTPPKKSFVDRFSHGRSSSVQNPAGRKKLTKTPPLTRNLSGDWGRSAGPSAPPQRPSSRGAGVNLDTAGQNLSATEQMQVSRATGTPLINLPGNNNKSQQLQPGLVGVVSQREREREASREGRSSALAQQAIERQRQQMQMEAEIQALQQHEMRMRQQQEMAFFNQQRYAQNQQYAPQMQPRQVYQGMGSWQQYQSGQRRSPGTQYGPQGDYLGQGQYWQQQQPQQQQEYRSKYFTQQPQQQQ